MGGMIPDPHPVATAGMRPEQQPFPWMPFLQAGKGRSSGACHRAVVRVAPSDPASHPPPLPRSQAALPAQQTVWNSLNALTLWLYWVAGWQFTG